MKKFLIGKRISLHGLSSEDINEKSPYFSWLDDLSLDLYTEKSYYPNNIQRMQDYYHQTNKSDKILFLGIFDNETKKHIGNLCLQAICNLNRRAEVAYFLGDKNFSRKGIVTEAVKMIMYYGFNKLNLERIHAGASERNLASIRIFEKCGLKIEGKMRNHLFRNGEFSDVVLAGAFRSEWMKEVKTESLFQFKPTY